jgi:hypothetical protein
VTAAARRGGGGEGGAACYGCCMLLCRRQAAYESNHARVHTPGGTRAMQSRGDTRFAPEVECVRKQTPSHEHKKCTPQRVGDASRPIALHCPSQPTHPTDCSAQPYRRDTRSPRAVPHRPGATRGQQLFVQPVRSRIPAGRSLQQPESSTQRACVHTAAGARGRCCDANPPTSPPAATTAPAAAAAAAAAASW